MPAKSVADQIRDMLEKPSVEWDEVPTMLSDMLEKYPELEHVGKKGMVVVPDEPHMTELMVGATRKIWMYFVGDSDERMTYGLIKHLATSDPAVIKWLPKWMFEYNQHVTKEACACIAHAVTVGSFLDPKPDSPPGEDVIDLIRDDKIQGKLRQGLDWYNKPPEEKRAVALGLSGRVFQRFTMELKDASGHTEISTFRTHPPVSFADGAATQRVSLHIARHELPKAWQKLINRTGGRLLFEVHDNRTVSRGPYFYRDATIGANMAKVDIVCTKIVGHCGIGEIEFALKNGEIET